MASRLQTFSKDEILAVNEAVVETNTKKATNSGLSVFTVACIADAINLLYTAQTDYTNGLDECLGWLQRRLIVYWQLENYFHAELNLQQNRKNALYTNPKGL